jgi:hypothetical protein
MRLDFNVLWVDDQPNLVAPQITAITAGMREEGFDFKPIQLLSLGATEQFLAGNVFTDEIDLVLVDWQLGGGHEGQEAIAAIREKIQYKDVVFYSGNNDTDELKRLAFEAGLEGVYCATRPVLVDEVLGVFESLVKKVLDLDHTRGIVMGATSDIDQMVVESIAAARAKLGAAQQNQLVADALGIIHERLKQHSELLTKLQGDPSMAALAEAHVVFTANDRLRMLSRALQLEQLAAHKGSRASVTQYIGEVVPLRNRLGHRVLSPEGRATAIAIGAGEQMNIDQMRDLRRLILDSRDVFRSLRDALTA